MVEVVMPVRDHSKVLTDPERATRSLGEGVSGKGGGKECIGKQGDSHDLDSHDLPSKLQVRALMGYRSFFLLL
jgi:hypothetical protein